MQIYLNFYDLRTSQLLLPSHTENQLRNHIGIWKWLENVFDNLFNSILYSVKNKSQVKLICPIRITLKLQCKALDNYM